MLQYAAIDAEILLPLYCIMVQEIAKENQNTMVFSYFKNERPLKNKGVRNILIVEQDYDDHKKKELEKEKE